MVDKRMANPSELPIDHDGIKHGTAYSPIYNHRIAYRVYLMMMMMMMTTKMKL